MARAIVDTGRRIGIEVEGNVLLRMCFVLVRIVLGIVMSIVRVGVLRGMDWQYRFLRAHATLGQCGGRVFVVVQRKRCPDGGVQRRACGNLGGPAMM